MDIKTLAAAKAYTDKKLQQGGNGNSSTIIDSSLTLSGAAADAFVVGQKIKNIEDILFEIEENIDESGVIEYDNSFQD